MDYIVGVVFVTAFTLERFRFVAVRDLEKFEPNPLANGKHYSPILV